MKVTKKYIGKKVTWEGSRGRTVVGVIKDVIENPVKGVDEYMYVVTLESGEMNIDAKLVEKLGVELC